MTEQEQRIAIAELSGWTELYVHVEDGWIWGVCPNPPKDDESGGWRCLPNFLTNLNAMHEVEKYANYGNFVIEYERSLILVLSRDESQPKNPFLWMASAPQRAEAFLRTFDRWK